MTEHGIKVVINIALDMHRIFVINRIKISNFNFGSKF